MITKKDLKIFGSADLISWMRESMKIMEQEFKSIYEKGTNVFHINTMDLESFKKSIEQYAKDNPNADIKASGFMISTKEPSKSEEYEYKPKGKKTKRKS